MMPQLSPAWQRFFVQPAASAPTAAAQRPAPPVHGRVYRLYGGYTAGSPVDIGGATPPVPPRPPVGRRCRPTPAKQPRRSLELAWLSCQMPEHMREQAAENLRQTLAWRAQHCAPLKPPKKPLAITRFGLLGEQLWPKGAWTIRRKLKMEARESVRLLEGTQPHLARNHLLAMRGARLGQLCVDLEERGLDALEVLRCELTWLWN